MLKGILVKILLVSSKGFMSINVARVAQSWIEKGALPLS